jgi:signal peptidase I
MDAPVVGSLENRMHGEREPWLAVNLSLLLPGIGHFYAGRPRIAWMLILVMLATLAIAIYCLLAPNGSVGFSAFMIMEGIFLPILVLIAAHRAVARRNSLEFEAHRKQAKDGWLAFFLSRIFPGLGHLYLGRIGMGILLLLIGVVIGVIPGPAIVSDVLVSLWISMCCYLAYRAAPAHRERDYTLSLKMAATVAVMLVGLDLLKPWLRANLVQAFRTPSESMRPTLEPYDYVWCDKRKGYEPKHGDVVVFRYPLDTTKDFLKRVIAVHGDRIEIRNKTVWLNGAPQAERYVAHSDSVIRSVQEDRRDNLRPIVVGPDQFFVLGDNRDNSNDSRYFGPVPRALIRGHVYKIYWPLARAGPIR